MSRLYKDFIGHLIEVKGSVYRPPAPTQVDLRGKVTTVQVEGTYDLRVRDQNGTEEFWKFSGRSAAYGEAKRTMPQEQFERFVAMEAGLCMSNEPVAREMYPAMAQAYPKGYIEYSGAVFKEHQALAAQLEHAVGIRVAARVREREAEAARAAEAAPPLPPRTRFHLTGRPAAPKGDAAPRPPRRAAPR